VGVSVVALYLVYRILKKDMPKSACRAVIAVGVALLLDIAIAFARDVVHKGVRVVLFYPIFLPVAVITALYYAMKENGRSLKARLILLAAGVPFVALAVYFEAVSFS